MWVDQATLRWLLHYDVETGLFTWAVTRTGSARAGTVAGSTDGHGYTQIKIGGRLYKAHRLAWTYMTGKQPPDEIDHRDGVRSNNAWRNLRPASRQQNAENKSLPSTNTSGYRGVTWSKKVGMWQAQLGHRGRSFFLGYFDDPAEASEAYKAARAAVFPFQPVARDDAPARMQPKHVGAVA